MDCHKTLVLALGLSASALGCVHQETVSKEVVETTPRPADKVYFDSASAKPINEDKRPKRKPTAALCVAFAKVPERGAEEENRESAERDSMRSQAIKGFKRALEIDPNYLDAWLGLARVHENSGDHDLAIEAYRKAMQKHPKNAEICHYLGMCHARHKEWDPAIEALRKGAELDHDNRLFVKTLGLCLARAGRYDESYECLKKAIGEPEAHFYVARILKHMDQKDAAMAHLQAALQADSRYTKAQQMIEEMQTPVPQYLPTVPASYMEMEIP